MDTENLTKIFGTAESVPPNRVLRAGSLAVAIGGGALRGIWWNNTEVLRGIDYPIRDENWGTHPVEELDSSIEEGEGQFAYRRSFRSGPFEGEFSAQGDASGHLALRLRLVAQADGRVNRAGFVVLHPVAGFAGSPLAVTHSDRRTEQTTFPTSISPSQPVFDIEALRQDANGVIAEIRFGGEVFEMEDQRNWSDASYKTYCRPLSKPYPYTIAKGEVVEQTITLSLSGAGAAASGGDAAGLALGGPTGYPMPTIALALQPGWEAEPETLADLRELAAGSTLLRLDLTQGGQDKLDTLRQSVFGELDLELVVSDDPSEIRPQLQACAETLRRAGLSPARITALPKAFLKSYQPDAQWPQGASPEDATAALREIFPGTRIGSGMLTNCSELNRYRSIAGFGDFLTHSTTAIVHAADDVSVIQTLEALPQIFASAESLAPGKPYRLGLVSIGMRSNPYGADVAKNPDRVRRAMAIEDPRQRGQFAAAWMIGALAATASSRVESLALAAPSGPFGLIDRAGHLYPAFHAFTALAQLQGQPRLGLKTPTGIAGLAVTSGASLHLILSNLSAEPQELALPSSGSILLLDTSTLYESARDPHWLETAARQNTGLITLEPYASAFIRLATQEGSA